MFHALVVLKGLRDNGSVKLASSLGSLFLLASVVTATPAVLPQGLYELRRSGFDALFNMNYEEAKTYFERMTVVDSRHPAGYIYMANTIWLGHLAALRRLQASVYNRDNSFFSESEDVVDPKVDKEFGNAISKGIALAQARLDSNKNDIAALYYLGIARNITAGYEATVKRSFFSALKNGSNGASLHRKVLAQDPKFVDANLSIGIFNYVVGSLPLAVKILVFFGGVHGSKKEGLKQLELVAREGDLARDEAAVLLIMLYDRENRLEESLELLKEESGKYPQNFFFRLQLGATLAQLHRYAESFRVFEALLKDPDAVDYMEDLIHYQYADALSGEKSWQKAQEHYTKAGRSPRAPESLVTMAHLDSGKCLDALGRRAEAVAEYKLVLKRKNIFDSRDLAKEYLKTPYQP